MEALRSLLDYQKHFEVDDREPVWFFTTTSWTKTPMMRFGLTAFDPVFWLIPFGLLLIQSVGNVIVAVIIYEFILKKNHHRRQKGESRLPLLQSSYLIGYGLIIPLLLYMPIVFLPMLDLRNLTFLATIGLTSPALLSFRCLEAMHGVLPAFVFDDKSKQPCLSKFILYYAASIQFNFDPKTQDVVRLTQREIVQRLGHFFRMFVETSIVYSILLPCDYQLFPKHEIHSFEDLFYWGNIANNFCMAYLTGIVMESGVTGLGIMTSLASGLSTMRFNDHPLLLSTSPSDFWGNRWNKIVGSALRRGVFRPLRQSGHVSRSVAALVTFLVSGLLHEYILLVMTLRGGGAPNNPDQTPFVPSYGNQWLFFAWNGAVLLAQQAWQDTACIQFIRNRFPRPIRTALVLLTVLPIAHLFTDEYVRSGFYSDLAMGFPRIVRIE